MPCFERTKTSTKHSGCLSEASNFRHPLFGEAEQYGPWLMTSFHEARVMSACPSSWLSWVKMKAALRKS